MMKKAIRTAQTFFPGLRGIKYDLQRYHRAIRRQPFEVEFSLLQKFFPKEDEVFIDVGANRGQSVQAIRLFKPEARIVCFEPSSSEFAALERYVRGDKHTATHNVALGSAENECALYTPVYNGFVFDGLASLDRREAEHWINDNTIYFFSPDRLSIRSETVTVKKLDDFGLEPCFVKIDVQGNELDVLAGAAETIDRHRPIIMLELGWESPEMTFLESREYEMVGYDGKQFRSSRFGRNAIFIHEQRRKELRV